MLGKNSLPHPTSFLLMTTEFALQGFYHTFLWRNSVQPRYGERCDPNSKSFCTYATVLLAPTSSTNHHRRLESLQQSYKKNTLGFEVVWTVSEQQGRQCVETFQAERTAQQRFLSTIFPILFPKEESAGGLIYNIQRLCNPACVCRNSCCKHPSWESCIQHKISGGHKTEMEKWGGNTEYKEAAFSHVTGKENPRAAL